MDLLDSLLQTAPTWACCAPIDSSSAAIVASVPRAGGVSSRTYHLVLTAHGSHVAIREAPKSRLLPKCCPDRHINPDGAFCLGLRAGHLVESSNGASEWWDKLLVFISCQETAHETRTWPEYAQLSHGEEAAEIELEAEELARELGLHKEYGEAVRGHENAVSIMAQRVDPRTMHLSNGRAPCVCGRVDRRGRSLLRRQCSKAGLKCLPILERQRLEAVRSFWTSLGNTPCCGTMDACPLRKAN